MAAARLRSPVGRAIGLGSAKEGVEHWWLQRVTAVALVPLTLWFVIAVVRLSSADIDTVRDWVGRPLPAILLVLLLIATFWHASLGVQVVIEDYVHAESARYALLILNKLLSIALAALGTFAVLKLSLAA